VISFFVEGTPKSQGSKRAFVPKGGTRPVLVESAGAAHKDWRALVSLTASQQKAKYAGAVKVQLEFAMRRPSYHYVSGDRRKSVKATSPQWVAKKPDVDKLVRSVLDSLSGIVFDDDSQVASLVATKIYSATKTGVMITVTGLEGAKDE
jgi:Holliday junction resolvase RusA-like endonuclease